MADGSGALSGERTGAVLPTIPELANVPARIESEDEGDIRWRLSNPSVATITQSSGAFGGQLERAECFGFGARPCRRCGGYRRKVKVEDRGEAVLDAYGRIAEDSIEWRDGSGRRPRNRFGRHVSYATALAAYRTEQRKEHKIVVGTYPSPSEESGVDAEQLWDTLLQMYWERDESALMTASDFREAFPRLPDALTEPCESCHGLGVVPRRTPGKRLTEVTAWPTGSSVGIRGRRGLDAEELESTLEEDENIHDANVVILVDALARWMGVEQILRDVEAISPIAREGIERFYAPTDSRASWGRLGLIELAGGASKVGDLQDHMSQVFNLAAYGAVS